ncbi:uncharacterized protein G2W53_012866 [Senna tora]|uniref:Uncharacterized protein n=1 Tax=Senna tora TaxID=362788 RepID=A0A834TXH1_9FABA|nr:uncharacterized protein G2W53_012866 [Senna tora]
MDISASQFSSASESGWTHYLDQSSLSGNCFQMSGGIVEYGGIVDEEEEEDLSMVSDASSGPPPHYHDDDDECGYEDWYYSHSSSQYTKESKEKKKKVKESYRHHQHLSHLDDDTASSPKKVNFSGNGEVENALDFSQGFSATRIKGKSKFQKQFGFFECSIAGKQGAKEEGSMHKLCITFTPTSSHNNSTGWKDHNNTLRHSNCEALKCIIFLFDSLERRRDSKSPTSTQDEAYERN